MTAFIFIMTHSIKYAGHHVIATLPARRSTTGKAEMQ